MRPAFPNTMNPDVVYREDFREGPGGWLGWVSNQAGASRLTIEQGAAISQGPWWIDYNHAPPGAGYLHLLFALHTHHWEGFPQQYKELGGRNHFIEGAYSRNLANATIHVCLRGNVDLRGAHCALLVQTRIAGKFVNAIYLGETFAIQAEWTWQSATLRPDPSQWVALGSRHDRSGFYGDAPIEQILQDVNGDIILVLFPLNVQPAPPLDADIHQLRAGEDYPVNRALLPTGKVWMDEIRIEWPPDNVR